jgi:HCOMODA/2-hydroxy-3-carboxy-muconic semialdehyde decarboxylase
VDTPAQETELAAEVAEAGRVMAALGLVTAFGHVSARAGAEMLVTPAARLGGVCAAGVVTVPLDSTVLPPGAPGEAWLHLAVYAARPDAAAIARAQPADGFAAAAVAGELRPLHGQAAWLGPVVPVHDDPRLLRNAKLAAAAAATLAGHQGADAMLLRGNGAVTTAATPGLAVVRMWLLAAACRAYLDASAAGQPVPLAPAEIAAWQDVQAEMLPRVWEYLRYPVPRTRSS